MNQEIWKLYKTSCNGKRVYEVSDQGRVRLNGVIVNFSKYKSPYYSVGSFIVHRAVAELFVPNPENKPCIDHINTNKHDNRAVNLRWVTYKENMNNPITKQHMLTTSRCRTTSYTQEYREKQRAIQKEVQNRPEIKAKQRAIQKEVRQRKEWKEKQHATMVDRKFLTNGIDRKFVRPELFDYYIERGYHFGMK